MPKSTYESRLSLNGRFRDGGPVPSLGTVYVALAGADLTKDNLVANELPIGTNGYARIAIGTTNADWTTPISVGAMEMISNTATLSGGTATGDLFGGAAIAFFGLYDAPNGGNLIRYGSFGTPKTILSGEAIVIAPGALQILE